MRKIKYFQAIKEAQTQLLQKDKSVMIMGLGVNDPKGIFGTTKDLYKTFGKRRILETPTSENAVTGVAIGAAIQGLRPILTHQRVEFSLLSIEQIINQAAKWHFMSAGNLTLSCNKIDYRQGLGTRSTTFTKFKHFSHIPGLKVVAPSSAYDASWFIS